LPPLQRPTNTIVYPVSNSLPSAQRVQAVPATSTILEDEVTGASPPPRPSVLLQERTLYRPRFETDPHPAFPGSVMYIEGHVRYTVDRSVSSPKADGCHTVKPEDASVPHVQHARPLRVIVPDGAPARSCCTPPPRPSRGKDPLCLPCASISSSHSGHIPHDTPHDTPLAIARSITPEDTPLTSTSTPA